jgi:Protein of unknown function (DUF3592)
MNIRMVPLILLGIGGLSLIVGILLIMSRRRFLRDAVSVQGTVTGHAERSGSEGGTVYSPVVQFTTVEGQALTFTESVASNPPRHQAGASVKVLYPPGNPQAARVAGWFGLWFLPTFALLFGLIFVGVGVPLYLFADDPLQAAGGSIPEIPESTVPSGLIPEIPGSGPGTGVPGSGQAAGPVLVVVQDGAPTRHAATCDSLRDVKGGQGREVRLGFDGQSVKFTARPFHGAGPYVAGQNLEATGSVFTDPNAEVSGAVIFDNSGEAGVINLVAGNSTVSGSWSCAGSG